MTKVLAVCGAFVAKPLLAASSLESCSLTWAIVMPNASICISDYISAKANTRTWILSVEDAWAPLWVTIPFGILSCPVIDLIWPILVKMMIEFIEGASVFNGLCHSFYELA
jgi:hypothetical protein